MAFSFEVRTKDPQTKARLGRLTTARGSFETPLFMPVGTRASVRTMSGQEVEELGFPMILANAYHLYLRPGSDLIRRAGGLHRFMGWNGGILTDSGGYQIFSLGSQVKVRDEGAQFRSAVDGSTHFLTPEAVMGIQQDLGSDIMMALDQCAPYPADRKLVEEAVRRTTHWAERSRRAWERGSDGDAGALTPTLTQGESEYAVTPTLTPTLSQWERETGRGGLPAAGEMGRGVLPPTDREVAGGALFGIVQGGVHPDLRKRSAQELADMDFPGYGIGGLSVGEPRELMLEALEVSTENLSEEKPRYLMGVGDPEGILEAIARGVDLFDSVLPTRVARNGGFYSSSGRKSIKNAGYTEDLRPLDESCDCRVCQTHSRAYLRHLYLAGEILALRALTWHNLAYLEKLVRGAREAIRQGAFVR